MWHDLFAAIALMLVIEGLMPFLHPIRFRKMIQFLLCQPDNALRVAGFVSMLLGIILLYFVRWILA